jgi:hypothetical protein
VAFVVEFYAPYLSTAIAAALAGGAAYWALGLVDARARASA